MSIPTFKYAKIHQQLSPDQLIDDTIRKKEGSLNDTGALCFNTGTFTGRSPADKFIVDEIETNSKIDWEGGFNHKISPERFELLKTDLIQYMDTRDELWYRKCYACAHPDLHVGIHVINECASGNLFAYNMFLRPEDLESPETTSEWTVLQAPGFKADPSIHGTRSLNFSVVSFSKKTILIGGTGYTGEIKKGIFTVLNFILPNDFHVLSMHCSANIGQNGGTALFFGLSGTGKTTLSTDPERKLIGDDEHGWDDTSIFNFEGGCYAKTIGLKKKYEPEIFAAIKHGALVENVVFTYETNSIDFHNSSLTENTRVSYPINYIQNIAVPSRGGIPSDIFYLTCDASGVLPPISKLNIAQAKYYFLSGYTSKVAGTETGITEPKPTFSTCFGAPFLPLNPAVYAELLGEKLKKHPINIWLVNTGWSGLPYGEGNRISIKYTRSMIKAALSGALSNQPFELFPVFNLMVPSVCPGVPVEMLNPIRQFEHDTDYRSRLSALAEKFNRNFVDYEHFVSQDILEVCPKEN